MTFVEKIMDKYRFIICSLGFIISIIALIISLTVKKVHDYINEVYGVVDIDYIS